MALFYALYIVTKEKDRKKAFGELVSRHRDMIWHVCSDYSFSAAWEVEDAVQEVLCALWRDFESLTKHGSERSWVYRVATNTMIDIKRKANNQPQLPEDHIPDHANHDDDGYTLLLQLIDMLESPDQQIIRAHLDNFRNYEISRMTGLSLATVGRRLRAIKQHLQEQYDRLK